MKKHLETKQVVTVACKGFNKYCKKCDVMKKLRSNWVCYLNNVNKGDIVQASVTKAHK